MFAFRHCKSMFIRKGVICTIATVAVQFQKGFIRRFRTKDNVHLAFDSVTPQNSSGSEKKPPIILLHGILEAKETWKRVLRPLAESTGRNVYAYDARDHGESGWSNAFNMEALHEDLLQFVNFLQTDRAILIGHSMGGRTSMHFSLQWPNKIEKLIIEEASPRQTTLAEYDEFAKAARIQKHSLNQIPGDIKDLTEAKKFVFKFIKDALTQKVIKNSNEVEIERSTLLPLTQDENGKYKWLANQDLIENGYKEYTSSSRVLQGTFKGPSLFIGGTKSFLKLPNERDFILQYFPNANIKAVHGARHNIHLSHEDVFIKEVTHFINDV